MKLITLLLAITMTAGIAAADGEQRPNILYIFTDDQSFRTVSCYPGAYEFANTPNIDRLAENGVRFDLAYIGAKCAPSRAMVQFGRQQFYVIADEELTREKGKGGSIANRTWFETMRDAGYFTGMIGKWHWGAKREQEAWDFSLIWDRGLSKWNYYIGTIVRLNGGEPFELGGYSTDRYTDYTVEFIEERAQDPGKPWLMWLCYGGVHGPYTPAERHTGTLADAPAPPVPEDIYGPRPDKPSHFQGSKWEPNADGVPVHHEKSLEEWVKMQTEAVFALDDGVGRIVESLKATGQLENTIIVFTSDQGYVWGHHGRKGKIDHYDACIRAPLIVHYPRRFAAGKVCKAPVNGPDVVRSFHAWSGVEPDIILTGRDMTPLVTEPESPEAFSTWTQIPTLMSYVKNRYDPWEMGRRLKEQRWKDCLYGGDSNGLEGDSPSGIPLAAAPWYFMIHNGEYKYTRYANPDRIEELYHTASDPDELTNLAVNPEYHDLLLELREACKQEVIRSGGAPFAEFLPIPRLAY